MLGQLLLAPAPAGQHTVIAKACKGVNDPLVASTKIRKATLKLYNVVVLKIEYALGDLRKALDTIHADYDTQESLYDERHRVVRVIGVGRRLRLRLRLNILKFYIRK